MQEGKALMIGTRAHDVGLMDVSLLADSLKEVGAQCVQLVAYKAVKGIQSKSGCINSSIAKEINYEFAKRGLKISLLGSYFNLLEEKEQLDEDIKRFKEYLKFAKDFNCKIVGTETGSYNKAWSYNPKNHTQEAFEQAVKQIKLLVNESERFGVNAGIEGVYNHVIYSPEKMAELIMHINSSNLKVIFDPVNYIHMDNYHKRDEIIKNAFDLFGEKIEVVHAKDFVIENGKIKQVALGKGLINFSLLLNCIKKEKRNIDVIIEELTGEDLINSLNYLKTQGF